MDDAPEGGVSLYFRNLRRGICSVNCFQWELYYKGSWEPISALTFCLR